MIIAVDFDGCLTREMAIGAPPVLRDGAADAIRGMHRAGHVLILHSVRFGVDGCESDASEAELFLRRAGLWTLFADVWRAPGKPHADLYLDNRCQRIGDLGRDVDGSVTWQTCGEWYGVPSDSPEPCAWAGDGDIPRLKVWRRIGDVVVWLVDGPHIRGCPDCYNRANDRIGDETSYSAADFTTGGNGARYPWVPGSEIWIDSAIAWEEIGFVVLHEAVERYWMQEGKTYSDAHDIATRIETRLRANPEGLEKEIEKALGIAHPTEDQ